MRILEKQFRDQRGQAMVEYHILIPASIIIMLLAYLLSPTLSDVYRHLVSQVRKPKECVPFAGAVDNALCVYHDYCEKVEFDGMNQGEFVYKGALVIDTIVIKAGQTYTIFRDDPSEFTFTTDDGCYRVTFKTNLVGWEKIGSGKTCQDISHIDVWQAPLCQ